MASQHSMNRLVDCWTGAESCHIVPGIVWETPRLRIWISGIIWFGVSGTSNNRKHVKLLGVYMYGFGKCVYRHTNLCIYLLYEMKCNYVYQYISSRAQKFIFCMRSHAHTHTECHTLTFAHATWWGPIIESENCPWISIYYIFFILSLALCPSNHMGHDSICIRHDSFCISFK